MTNASLPRVVVLATTDDVLTLLGGISLLERLLRTLQRLGCREATVVSDLPAVHAHFERRSWASAEISVNVEPQVVGAGEAVLLASAAFVYDARLLRALADASATTLLIDSDPPADAAVLWEGVERMPVGYFCRAALVRAELSTGHVLDDGFLDALTVDAQERVPPHHVQFLDAARLATYVVSMRRNVRPFCIPAPKPEHVARAERALLTAAQNGTLDLPALVHAPIENWIVRHLCRTSITPNQITSTTMVVGVLVTILFATGSLWWGTLLALIVGVLDGVDGKLARFKVETTPMGQWEHELDYVVELSWWTALAFRFEAYGALLLLIGSDLLGRAAKRAVKKQTGRNLDDASAFDRVVRTVAGRRNIYIWIFALGLSLGAPRLAFLAIAAWATICTAEYCARALKIRLSPPKTA
jgi:phosphatidylglycerophosphate synthase